jgi:XTP/dITP diphosphohydrolase
MELILATRNAHKAREFSRMLAPYGVSVQPLPDHVELLPEDGETFEANAKGKAFVAAAELEVPVIADDSGIEAEALDGRPGVYSARFAGEHASDSDNLEKLLAEAPAGSRLRYVCALVYAVPEPADNGPFRAFCYRKDRPGIGFNVIETFFGECRGTLAQVPGGDGGFGYDPAFIPDELADGRTMAQISAAEKDALSHRGRAVRAFAEWLSTSKTG